MLLLHFAISAIATKYTIQLAAKCNIFLTVTASEDFISVWMFSFQTYMSLINSSEMDQNLAKLVLMEFSRFHECRRQMVSDVTFALDFSSNALKNPYKTKQLPQYSTFDQFSNLHMQTPKCMQIV